GLLGRGAEVWASAALDHRRGARGFVPRDGYRLRDARAAPSPGPAHSPHSALVPGLAAADGGVAPHRNRGRGAPAGDAPKPPPDGGGPRGAAPPFVRRQHGFLLRPRRRHGLFLQPERPRGDRVSLRIEYAPRDRRPDRTRGGIAEPPSQLRSVLPRARLGVRLLPGPPRAAPALRIARVARAPHRRRSCDLPRPLHARGLSDG